MMLDGDDARRCHRLGKAGERLARRLLTDAAFTRVENLNAKRANYPYADFVAERNGTRYVISVKIRNKLERSGSLNGRFKLGAKCHEHAAAAERNEHAIAAWLTIAIEESTFDAYFGTLKQLDALGLNGKGVMMTPDYTSGYECLAKKEPHDFDYNTLKNYVRNQSVSGLTRLMTGEANALREPIGGQHAH